MNEETTSSALPHLSHSRISRYLHCPEQYRLYYVERLRPKVPPSSLVFGKTVHAALAGHLAHGEDPVALFEGAWGVQHEVELTYSKRESWDKLRDVGSALLERFVTNHRPRIDNVRAVEEHFTLNVSGFPVPLIGIVDLVADLDGRRTVVDFKTSGSTLRSHEVVLSDQLTAYKLAEPEVEQTALCAFVKTNDPRIEWHVGSRSGTSQGEFLAKAKTVVRAIGRSEFHRRPGIWCTWCDYLPVCTGNRTQAQASLIQVS